MPRKKLPPDILEFFRKQGSKGGKRSLETMTPEARVARAKKAAESMTPEARTARSQKAAAIRWGRAKAKKRLAEK